MLAKGMSMASSKTVGAWDRVGPTTGAPYGIPIWHPATPQPLPPKLLNGPAICNGVPFRRGSGYQMTVTMRWYSPGAAGCLQAISGGKTFGYQCASDGVPLLEGHDVRF